jgi:hypothetical protein
MHEWTVVFLFTAPYCTSVRNVCLGIKIYIQRFGKFLPRLYDKSGQRSQQFRPKKSAKSIYLWLSGRVSAGSTQCTSMLFRPGCPHPRIRWNLSMFQFKSLLLVKKLLKNISLQCRPSYLPSIDLLIAVLFYMPEGLTSLHSWRHSPYRGLCIQ